MMAHDRTWLNLSIVEADFAVIRPFTRVRVGGWFVTAVSVSGGHAKEGVRLAYPENCRATIDFDRCGEVFLPFLPHLIRAGERFQANVRRCLGMAADGWSDCEDCVSGREVSPRAESLLLGLEHRGQSWQWQFVCQHFDCTLHPRIINWPSPLRGENCAYGLSLEITLRQALGRRCRLWRRLAWISAVYQWLIDSFGRS